MRNGRPQAARRRSPPLPFLFSFLWPMSQNFLSLSLFFINISPLTVLSSHFCLGLIIRYFVTHFESFMQKKLLIEFLAYRVSWRKLKARLERRDLWKILCWRIYIWLILYCRPLNGFLIIIFLFRGWLTFFFSLFSLIITKISGTRENHWSKVSQLRLARCFRYNKQKLISSKESVEEQ